MVHLMDEMVECPERSKLVMRTQSGGARMKCISGWYAPAVRSLHHSFSLMITGWHRCLPTNRHDLTRSHANLRTIIAITPFNRSDIFNQPERQTQVFAQ